MNLYSNQIIVFINSSTNGESVKIDENLATNCIGLSQLAGAILAPIIAVKAPVRLVIIAGQALAASLIAAVGYFVMTQDNLWLLICMYGSLFVTQLTVANMYWIYVGQIACEKGVGLAGGMYWGLFLAASFLT